MILNQDKTTAVTVGEIQNNRVGIDTNNINFITTLLTSNLYSYPIESFLRETVSNAWDSQVEAGNTNVPILIKIHQINEDDDCLTISIRDYGTGLSPERFDNIYKNIGSSTKRNSNDFIGCLGIGRFASLAVSNTVTIRSYYQGKCYSYLMYKDGETLNIDLLSTVNTQYDNGVEVSVTITNARYERFHIIGGLAALSYFEQIYVDNDTEYLKDFVTRFNKRTIHEYNTFKVCSIKEVEGMHILMGNVLYKINERNYNHFLNSPNVAITCNIGEVDITPNREGLRYSDKTKATLENKVLAFDNEVYSLCNNLLTGSFNTIEEWNRTVNNTTFELILWNFDGYVLSIEVTKVELTKRGVKDNSTIRNHPVPKHLMVFYNLIISSSIPNTFLTYCYENNMFFKPNATLVRSYIHRHKCCYLDEPFKVITKQYYREHFDNTSTYFIRKSQLKIAFIHVAKAFYKWFYEWNKNVQCNPKDALKLICEEIYAAFKSFPTFNNSDVPKQWIDEQKVAKVAAARRNLVIYELTDGRSCGSVSCKTEHDLDYFLKYNGTVVYGEKGDEDLIFTYKAVNKIGGRRVCFISVAKSNMHIIQNIKRFVFIDDFMYDNKYFRMAFTGKYLLENKLCFRQEQLWLSQEYKELMQRHFKCINASLNLGHDDKIDNLYKHYVDTHQLYYSIIADANNADIRAIDKFANKQKISFHLDDNEMIAIMYFIYKNNLKIFKLNRITAFKYLQKHCAI